VDLASATAIGSGEERGRRVRCMGKQRGVNDGVAYSLDEWASKRPSNKNGPDANIVDFKKIY
jgi:hypothetical protein